MTEWGWRGITLGPAPFFVSQVEGWIGHEGQASGFPKVGVGAQPGAVYHGPRIVRMRGFLRCQNQYDRNAQIDAMREAMVPAASLSTDTEPLTSPWNSTIITADAQLTKFTMSIIAPDWNAMPRWEAEFYCRDPRFYFPWVTDTAALAVPVTGLTLPFTLPVTFPDNPLGGQVSLYNYGNDKDGSPVRVTLTGAQVGVGLEVIGPTKTLQLTWPVNLSVADTFVVDTSTGGASLNGESRAASGVRPVSDLLLERGASTIRALGTPGAGSPTITAAVRPRSFL